jgi:formylmethanofuran dehydrogenase subunit E
MTHPRLSPSVSLDETPEHLRSILAESVQVHKHLCPRQILGARIGLAGAAALGFDVPHPAKQLLAIVETDGCFVSGVQAATGLRVNRRTMRIEDYGKTAVTFVDVRSGEAVRVSPALDIRETAWDYARPGETRRYFAMLHGYMHMPADELLRFQEVVLARAVQEIISRPGVRRDCARCGEEIINEREVWYAGEWVCQSCAGDAYYKIP